MKKLPVLCPQQYLGTEMQVTSCTRCPSGWDKSLGRCTVTTGAEHLKNRRKVPDCPMQDRCQHQLQSTGPCVIRSKGLICESALLWSGLSVDAAYGHPLAFNASLYEE